MSDTTMALYPNLELAVNLRAPCGGGKSYVGRWLKGNFHHRVIMEAGWLKTKLKPAGYILPGGLIVLGKYEGEFVTSGGLDTYKPMDQVYALIRRYAPYARFLFYESLMISTTYGRSAEVAAEFGGSKHLFATLDTPQEVCVARMHARVKAKAANTTNLPALHKRVHRTAERFAEDGYPTVDIRHEDSLLQVLGLFRNAGWEPEAHPQLPMEEEWWAGDLGLGLDEIRSRYDEQHLEVVV